MAGESNDQGGAPVANLMPQGVNQATGFQFVDTGTVKAQEEAAAAANQAETENNGGQGFDFDAFWKGPEAEGSPGQETGSPAVDSSAPGQQTPQNPADALNEQIGRMDFGVQDLSEDDIAKINAGDTSPLTSRITEASRAAVKETIMTMAPLLNNMQESMMSKVQDKINQSFDVDKAETALQTDLLAGVPEAQRQFVKPIAEAMLTQAKINNKGDLSKAIPAAKAAIKHTIEGLAGSVDLEVAAPSSGQERPGNETMEGNFDWEQFSGLARK